MKTPEQFSEKLWHECRHGVTYVAKCHECTAQLFNDAMDEAYRAGLEAACALKCEHCAKHGPARAGKPAGTGKPWTGKEPPLWWHDIYDHTFPCKAKDIRNLPLPEELEG